MSAMSFALPRWLVTTGRKLLVEALVITEHCSLSALDSE
jgi:hypothetical protein